MAGYYGCRRGLGAIGYYGCRRELGALLAALADPHAGSAFAVLCSVEYAACMPTIIAG